MVRSRYKQMLLAQLLLYGVITSPEDLMDPILRRVDSALDDEALVEAVLACFRKRRPNSGRRGRRGTPAEVALRMLVLKHLRNWSFETLEWEVRGSIVYRRFCRIDAETVPDAKTMIRLAQLVDGPVLRRLFERVTALAVERRIAKGQKMRIDTTVVEAPIHYPTDSRLLEDSIRLVGRHVRRVARAGVKLAHPLRNTIRSVGRRAREIAQIARQRGDAAKEAIKKPYRGLLRIAGRWIRDGEDALERARATLAQLDAKVAKKVERSLRVLETILPRARLVVRQTRARVLRGITTSAEKLISIFEPTAQILRRGKPHKPTEFGMLVKVQEAEHGLIVDIGEVPDKADAPLLVPATEHHIATFGHAPHLVATDRGFFSAENEARLAELGVRTIATPKPGHKSKDRVAHERKRAFRRARAWRAGGEARISHLKHDFGMERSRYKGPSGIHRSIHWAAIANNLKVIARGAP